MAEKELKNNEVGINLDDYQGSCSTKEAIDHMAEELLSDLIHNLATTRAKLDNLDKNRDFLTNKAKLIARQSELQRQIDTRKNQLLKKTPLLTKMYNLRESAKNEPLKPGEKIESKIEFNQDGSPYLKISKKMGEAIGFDFTITGDGKVIFGQMSDDKMVEVLDFLYRRGITGFELPQGAPKTPEEAQKRVEEQKKEGKTDVRQELDKETFDKKLAECSQKYDDPANDPRYIPEGPSQEAPQASNNTATALPQDPQALAAAQEEARQAELAAQAAQNGQEAPKPEFKPVKGFRDYIENRLGRTKPNGYRESYNILDSSTTFSVYVNNDKNYHNEKVKKGSKEEPGLLYRVKIKRDKSGALGLSYYVPKNGKLPDELAGQLVNLAKKDGALYVDFPENIPESDASVFRKACAQNGVIPTGVNFNLDQRQAANMIRDAEGSLNDKNLLKYKGQLGRYLLEQAVNKNNTALQSYAMQLVNEEKFTPLKDFCDTTFKEIAENSTKTGVEAKEVIGSANAVKRLYNLYDQEKTIAQSGFTPEELRALNIDPNTPVNQLDQEQLKAVYGKLKDQEVNKAKQDLDKIDSNYSAKEHADAVKEAIGEAQGTLNSVIADFDANGLKGLRCSLNKNTPKHQRPASSHSAGMSKSQSAGIEL